MLDSNNWKGGNVAFNYLNFFHLNVPLSLNISTNWPAICYYMDLTKAFEIQNITSSNNKSSGKVHDQKSEDDKHSLG